MSTTLAKHLKILMLFMLLCAARSVAALEQGKRYKLVKPVFISAWYNNLDKKILNKENAKAYLQTEKNADRPYVAFQSEVPASSIMTIIGPAPKHWWSFFYADTYLVKLEPDVSQGLDIEIQLDRGMEGTLDGLNPEIFSLIK
jgi:hypothetical protein